MTKSQHAKQRYKILYPVYIEKQNTKMIRDRQNIQHNQGIKQPQSQKVVLADYNVRKKRMKVLQ